MHTHTYTTLLRAASLMTVLRSINVSCTVHQLWWPESQTWHIALKRRGPTAVIFTHKCSESGLRLSEEPVLNCTAIRLVPLSYGICYQWTRRSSGWQACHLVRKSSVCQEWGEEEGSLLFIHCRCFPPLPPFFNYCPISFIFLGFCFNL